MTTQIELSDAAMAAIDKATKLLNLANHPTASEGERTNALDMAMQILERHGLDVANVEQHNGRDKAHKRADQTKAGGLYKWQRTVWEHVAKLNMCVYQSIKGLTAGSKYEQRVFGRPENVIATNLMAEYLQGAIERTAATWAKDNGFTSRFVKDAIIFREGMAERICGRLDDMRWERVQRAKREEAERRANAPKGTGTSLVLADVIQTEQDLNEDYRLGLPPGTTGRLRAENEARWAAVVAESNRKNAEKAARRMIDPAFDLICKAEEAEAKRINDEWDRKYQAKSRRSRGSGYSTRETAEDRRRNHYAHYEGRDAGENVGLDTQVGGGTSNTRRIK